MVRMIFERILYLNVNGANDLKLWKTSASMAVDI